MPNLLRCGPETATHSWNSPNRLGTGSARAHVARGDYVLAAADCNVTLKLSLHDPILHFTRGNTHLLNGKPEPAPADFNAAAELDPTRGRSTYGRGLARLLLSDGDGEERDFQRARELGFEDQDQDT